MRVDLPDGEARRAILTARLRGRPVADELDLDTIVDRTEGLTPAALSAVVEAAALAAFRESTASRLERAPITTARLLGALLARGGSDRPTATAHGWDDLVLDPPTKGELRQLQRLIEDPELARRFGIDPPSGLLLAGPPGTGKTTIARVLAAEAQCSFYSVSAADLTSKWVAESEHRIQALFARARDNAPSIVFLDELDAIARRRLADQDVANRQLTQLLTEIDGVGSRPGVFVVGATNRPDMLDEAITRGGRLSRTIMVPLPDLDARTASSSSRPGGCRWGPSTSEPSPASPTASRAATSRPCASRRPSTPSCGRPRIGPGRAGRPRPTWSRRTSPSRCRRREGGEDGPGPGPTGPDAPPQPRPWPNR